MRYSIHQLDATTWELRLDGTALARFSSAGGRTGYDLAFEDLSKRMTAELAAAVDMNPQAPTGDGLLPEGWTSPALALSEKLPGGRDFTGVAWSWRDPAAALVPLMFQQKNAGHYDADLVGFFTEIANNAGTLTARGRFYDTEAGQEARTVLLDGRPFGVSVDPTEAVEAEYDMECTEWTDDGSECLAAEESVKFISYEVGGATMHPFQGFDKAQVLLDPNPAAAAAVAAPVRASLSIPTAPPRDWFDLAEPKPGVPFLDGLSGDDVLVEQTNRAGDVEGFAVPVVIREDGLVYGHLTYWGQCHTGNPWGAGLCASASPSSNDYRDFHAGEVLCADGSKVATGRLVVGCEHSDSFDVAGVRDHMAQAGMGWASVRVVDGDYGPWLCGALEPILSESQVRMLRSLSLSGEWVGELGGILAVNASGLPVQREKLAASGFGVGSVKDQFVVPQAALRASVKGGSVVRLVGGNIVRQCPECAARRASRNAAAPAAGGPVLAELLTLTRTLESRTRHLVPIEAEATLARLARP
jgi:hypothetical protein